MNTYLEAELARGRLDEARAWAAREALAQSLRPAPQPVRVWLGLALVKAGQWLAGSAGETGAQPGRITA